MGERTVAHDADAMAEARRKCLLLLAPVEHVIAHLRHIDAARAHALRDHRAGEVRHTDEAGASGRHHVVERAHGVVERRARIRPVDEQHIDPVGAQAFQARVDLAEDVGAARIAQRPELTGRRRLHPALGDEDDVAPVLLERARHDLLRVPGPVGWRRVHAVHALVEGAVDRLDGIVVLDRPVAIAGHRPAAEADGGDGKSSAAEWAVAHRVSPLSPRGSARRSSRTRRARPDRPSARSSP